jgi:hypothetical protein
LGVLHFLWVRHHLLPGDFWKLPRGEQLILIAGTELELEAGKKAREEA